MPASATFRSRYLHLINRSRVRRDLRPLKLHLKLSGDALAHTHNMIRKNRLFDIGDLVLLLYPYAGSKTIGADVVGAAARWPISTSGCCMRPTIDGSCSVPRPGTRVSG